MRCKEGDYEKKLIEKKVRKSVKTVKSISYITEMCWGSYGKNLVGSSSKNSHKNVLSD